MCFSASANFVATAAIAGIGVATMRRVIQPRAVLFAATPLLFALHQFTEGFVWLGLEGHVNSLTLDHSAFLFMLYAQGLLPFLMPLAVLLMEPRGGRWLAIAGCTLLGAMLCVWTTYAVVAFPTRTFVDHHSIAYRNPMTGGPWVAGVYVAATCGALLLSSHRVVRWFGILNIVGLTIVMAIKGYAFTSVWCLYAAVLSLMLYWQFRGGHVDVDQPNSSFRVGDEANEWRALRDLAGI